MLIFGGAYSNLQALEKLKQIAEEKNIPAENIICTGDIVGYCANPRECLDILKDWGIHAIQGNVEENLLSGSDDCGCNYVVGGRCEMFSKMWFPFAMQQVSEQNRAYMAALPKQLSFQYAGKTIAVIHGSATYISDYVFESSPWKIKEANLKALGADVVLAGHCGIPFGQEKDGLYWLNAGVIGMPPNDGEPYVWFLTLSDKQGFDFQFEKFEYDNFEANQRMMENALPLAYAETLLTGLWDNVEILPPTEAAAQGTPLNIQSHTHLLN